MKNKAAGVLHVFLAMLTVCLFSCTNPTTGQQFLIGSAANRPNDRVTESQKPDLESKPPSVPNGAGTGSSQPAQPLDSAAKKKILFERLTDAVLRFEEEVDVSDLHISCASEPDKTPEYQALYENFAHYLDEQTLFLFHLPLPKNISCKYKQDNEDEAASYRLVYHIPAETAYADYNRIVTAFERYYQAVKKGMSQEEISYALYRELAKRTVYDENIGSKYQRTVCGAVVDGKGICEDFSIGYKQLMNGAGIEVCCLEGNIQRIPTLEGSIAHMWNRIKLGGAWYNVDATWDNNDEAEKTLRAHSSGNFFLKSDDTFYGTLNHTLIYDKLLPVPQASDTRYENPAYIFYDGDTKSDPFYYKGYWYYFSYQDMALYRSRFDGTEKKQLYQKMYHTDQTVYQPNYTKIHRIEFGTDKIYFLDRAEQSGSNEYALYTMPYDGGPSSVQKIGAAPSPDHPLHPIEEVAEQKTAGMTALRTEIMFSKMKDAYFHGAESYFTVKNPDRQRFRTQIQAAEDYVKSSPVDEAHAEVLYNQLRQARIHYGNQPTR